MSSVGWHWQQVCECIRLRDAISAVIPPRARDTCYTLSSDRIMIINLAGARYWIAGMLSVSRLRVVPYVSCGCILITWHLSSRCHAQSWPATPVSTLRGFNGCTS